ncbi:MAG: CHAT domain-containing protein [Acidobacteriia bacterium]|nr:CHAT domain-containing protein [Terriglobia bacterium]
MNKRAHEMFQKGHFGQMMDLLEPARPWIQRYPINAHAMKTLVGLGVAETYCFRFQDAIRDNLAGREMARKLGDWDRVGGFSHNLSNLYIILYAQREAMVAADEAIAAFRITNNQSIQPQLLLHKARLTALQGDFERAIPIFRQGIEAAELGGKVLLQASGLERLGLGFLKEKRLDEAETALVASFRLRKFSKDPAITSSYQAMGLLRLAQGETGSALRLFDLAVQGPPDGIRRHPAWSAYFGRGKVLTAQGRLQEALNDLRTAIHQIEDARIHLVPADSIRVSTGMGVQEVYSAFIQVGAKLYAENHRRGLVEETLIVAEANRALGLRQASAESTRLNRILPAAYMEKLAQLQSAYAALYREASPERRHQVERLRLSLTEMEASADAGSPVAEESPFRKESLSASQALLVFHLAEDSSYLWAATRGGVSLHKLPSKTALASQVSRLREAIEKDDPEAAQIGETLYATLFSSLGEARSKRDWLIVPDDALYQLPFPALVARHRGGAPAYLVEEHSLLVLPGLWAMQKPIRRSAVWSGPAVAVADPIYNRADARWAGGGRSGMFSWFHVGGWNANTLELARLPGSGHEVEACERAWARPGGGSTVILRGRQANLESLDRALSTRPAVLHFATHVVPSPDNDRENLLALSIDKQAEPQLVGPEWIASRQLDVALVMMSGCRSGAGEVKQGEGLMGLTRAWLMAGAGAVAATHWPIPDEGHFAQSFYRHWMQGGAAPDVHQAGFALQAAQVEMIRSGTFRTRPRYWASYFIVGKS